MKNPRVMAIVSLAAGIVLCTALHAPAITIEIAGGGTNIIALGDSWSYLGRNSAPSTPATAWKEPGFDDSTWSVGPSGFGYADGDDATVLDMQGNYGTLYVRKEFTAPSPLGSEALQLVIAYDDGFIAYLNGAVVARRNMPEDPVTFATFASSSVEAGTPVSIDLGMAQDILSAGTNVIAIEGHNSALDSTDFSLLPALRTVSDLMRDGDRWIVGTESTSLQGTTSSATATTVKIDGTDAAFDPATRSWQGTVSLVPGLNEILVQALDSSLAVVDSGSIEILRVPASNHAQGSLAADTTWSGAWIVDADLSVPAGTTLTILPGTIVMVGGGVSIFVEGSLQANGTEMEPIEFTHAGDGTTWERIIFTAADDSAFRHSTFQHTNSVGEHQDYYLPGPRDYHEGIVALATHLEFERCTFTKMPDTEGEGDALAIISDDEDHPGTASANIIECRFDGIGQGIHTRFAHVLVDRCYFVGKNGDNDDVDLWGESDPPPVVQYCHFALPNYEDRVNPTRCSAILIGNLIEGSSDHGIVLRDAGSPILLNNVIRNCSSAGVAIENSCTALLVNNTIQGCGRGLRLFDLGRWDSPYFLNPGGGTAKVVNCIIWDSPAGQAITLADSANTTIPDRGSHVTVISSDIQRGQAGGVSISGTHSTVTWGEGNIDLNPLFVDPAALDFHLQEGSPAIDSGTAEDAPATDRDRNPRSCGSAIDMGAHEVCTDLPVSFRRGDANADGEIDISDAVTTLLYLFLGSATPPCLKSLDSDDDGSLAITDAIYLLGHLFSTSPAPPPPLETCGPDPTSDGIECAAFPACP